MKKHMIAAAIVTLVALGGCDSQPKEEAAANAEMLADDIEARANALEAEALNATTPVYAPEMSNTDDPAMNSTANQVDSER